VKFFHPDPPPEHENSVRRFVFVRD